jgi:hypothetical protein
MTMAVVEVLLHRIGLRRGRSGRMRVGWRRPYGAFEVCRTSRDDRKGSAQRGATVQESARKEDVLDIVVNIVKFFIELSLGFLVCRTVKGVDVRESAKVFCRTSQGW